MNRQDEYLEQRLILQVDLDNKTIIGESELVLAPKSNLLNSIRVHARQLQVLRVTVNDVNAEFEHLNFLQRIVSERYRDVKAFDVFYRGALVASNEGELIIQVPPSVKIIRLNESTLSSEFSSNVSCPCHLSPCICTNRPWNLQSYPKSTTEYECLRVKIFYRLEDPKGGLCFLTSPSPLMYTCSGPFAGLCDGARTWFPCRDALKDRCCYKIEISIPMDCVAICGGELIEHLLDPIKRQRIFRYRIDFPITATALGLVVAQDMKPWVDPKNPRVISFCSSSNYENLKYSLECKGLDPVVAFTEKYLNTSYPFSCYHQIFLKDPPDQLKYLCGMAILDEDLLYDCTILDQRLQCHLLQAKGFLGSWIGGIVGILTMKDAWVLVGILGYFLNTYVKECIGEDEHRYRIQAAMDALTTLELTAIGNSPSLVLPDIEVYAEYKPNALPFLEVKAPLVLHMLEQRVSSKHLKSAIQLVVVGKISELASVEERNDEKQGVAPPAVASPGGNEEIEADNDVDGGVSIEGEDIGENTQSTENGNSTTLDPLSTYSFLKAIKNRAGAAGQDVMKSFLSNWITEGGIPFFTVGYWYNRKQNQAEVVLQQEVPPGGKLYTGPITVVVYEDNGKFPHPKRIEQRRHKWDFPCHSKVRKKRRKRQGLEDPDDSVSVTGPGMGLNDTPVFWVQIDPNFAWLRHIAMHQPDFNWMEQLLSDKDAAARIQAVRSLAMYPQPHEKGNVMACRAITECLSGLTTHSPKMRFEGALALGAWQTIHAPLTNANPQHYTWKGLQNLLQVFKEHFFDRNTGLPLPNYFLPSGKVVLEALGSEGDRSTENNVEVQEYATGEYEIKKAIPKAMVAIHAQNSYCPPEIQGFLLQLLRENDNSKNYIRSDDKKKVVDDCYYIGTLVISLSNLNLERAAANIEADEAALEIIRYLHYDQICPSYRHIVSACCIEALCNLEIAGRCSQKVTYHEFASEKYHKNIRKAAIESVIRLYFSEGGCRTAGLRNVLSGNLMLPRTQLEKRKANRRSLSGPIAAFDWVLRLLLQESSSGIRLFAVQALLDACRGFPPHTAAELLSNKDHSYILELMDRINRKNPLSFIQQSPLNSAVSSAFQVPSLAQLSEGSEAARGVVEMLWELLNYHSALDQRFRVALFELYRLVWGNTTPLCVAHSVEEKSTNWAGGFEALRSMIEDGNNRQKLKKSNHEVEEQKREELNKIEMEKRATYEAQKPKVMNMIQTNSRNFDAVRGAKVNILLGTTLIRKHKI